MTEQMRERDLLCKNQPKKVLTHFASPASAIYIRHFLVLLKYFIRNMMPHIVNKWNFRKLEKKATNIWH